MPSYQLLTNPSIELISEISKIYNLNFDYVEICIESPEGNPDISNKKNNKDVIKKLLEKFISVISCKVSRGIISYIHIKKQFPQLLIFVILAFILLMTSSLFSSGLLFPIIKATSAH